MTDLSGQSPTIFSMMTGSYGYSPKSFDSPATLTSEHWPSPLRATSALTSQH